MTLPETIHCRFQLLLGHVCPTPIRTQNHPGLRRAGSQQAILCTAGTRTRGMEGGDGGAVRSAVEPHFAIKKHKLIQLTHQFQQLKDTTQQKASLAPVVSALSTKRPSSPLLFSPSTLCRSSEQFRLIAMVSGSFLKTWVKPEVYPLVAAVGTAVSFMIYSSARAVFQPDVL